MSGKIQSITVELSIRELAATRAAIGIAKDVNTMSDIPPDWDLNTDLCSVDSKLDMALNDAAMAALEAG